MVRLLKNLSHLGAPVQDTSCGENRGKQTDKNSGDIFTSTEVGTPQYMAPEAGKRERIADISDMADKKGSEAVWKITFCIISFYIVCTHVITVALYRHRP